MAGNLGTLTIDLIAKTGGFTGPMDKAARQSKGQAIQMQKEARAIGTAFVAGLTVAAGAVTLFVKQTIDAADKARETAQSIGLTTEAFQALSFAASTAGVNQEGFAKAMKRLSVSMFDAASGVLMSQEAFAALGVEVLDASGRLRASEDVLLDMADLFSTLPDGVEKTAIAMKVLGKSGADLIPLLNGGRESIEALMAQAERLGFVMGAEAAEQADQFNDSLTVLNAVAQGFWNDVTVNLLPALNAITLAFIDLSEDGEAANTAASTLAGTLKNLASVGVGIAAIFELNAQAIAGVAATIANLTGGLDLARKTAKLSEEEFQKTLTKYAELLDKINSGSVAGESSQPEQIKQQAELLKQLTATGEAEKKKSELQREGEAVTKAVRTEAEAYGDEMKRLDELLKAGAISQDTFNRAQLAAGEKGFEDSPEFRDQALLDPFGALNDQRQKLEEWYAAQLELLAEYRSTRTDMEEEWNVKERALAEKHAAELNKIETARARMVLGTTSDLFGSLADAVGNYQGEQTKAYKALFAASKAFSIAESTLNMFQAISEAGTLPWPANLAAMASVAASMAGIIASVSAVGMAHDGIDSVPETGTWLLKKNERVMTSQTSKRLDDTLSRIDGGGAGGGTIVNVYAPAGSDVRQEKSQDGGMEKIDIYIDQAVSAKINTPGSKINRSLQNTFGLGQQLTKR